ncbi:MAG: hypothetical protein KFF50_13255, partial [Desulfatitalea sp.]|nr:hypothetical protein [Desulfatitalea sp.]
MDHNAAPPVHATPPISEDLLRNQQRLRFQRFMMALGTYVVVILVTFLSTRFGFGQLTSGQWGIVIGLALLLNLAFFMLFATGANLRFADPSLTWAQIFFSGLWGLSSIHFLWQMRPVLLMFYTAAFSFGILRLNRRNYLQLAAYIMALYTLLLVFEYHQPRPGFQLRYEILVCAIFGALLTWLAFFGGYVSDIRRRLRRQKEALETANTEIRTEIEERRRAQIEKDNLIVELQSALSKVKALSGLLPICSACKKIRDDQ